MDGMDGVDTPLLIVGAGPTGLMLAGWLARLGVHPLVIDKKSGVTRESRALAVQARTLETYDALGIVERALPQGVRVAAVNVLLRQRRVGRLMLGEIGSGLSPYPYVFIMSQDKTEQLLLQHYLEHGGQVRWETSLAGLEQDDGGVVAELRQADGRAETVRVGYVCGCDGAGSAVRQALGIEFAGGTYAQRFFVADVRGTFPTVAGELSIWLGAQNFLAFFPMPGEDRYRIVGVVPAGLVDRHELTFEEIRPEIERDSDMRVSETFWFSTYSVHHRVAESFRRGRAFLLGDAGHVHSPVGGQGMNTGLMDASNLGWKLAAVLRGEANEQLLASYEPERMPFARLLVNTTDRAFSAVASPSRWVRLLRSGVAPATLTLGARLPQVRRALFGLVSQTRINYYDSPLSRGAAGGVRAGDRLPWVRWRAGVNQDGSNYDALRLLTPHLQVYGPVAPAVEQWASQHPEWPLAPMPWAPEAARAGFRPGACYVVRPDGYVAYASPHFDGAELQTYLRDIWGWGGAGTNRAGR
jgi:2-polyprenyl-6-methoxyphenol hydroxylase-like FAD-dependent oxidoreductase